MKKIKKDQITKFFIPAIAIFMLANVLFDLSGKNDEGKNKIHDKEIKLPKSDTKKSISGIGIVEPKSDIISVGTYESGIVSDIYVKVGQVVKKGNWLFKIDDRKAKSMLNLNDAKLKSKKLEYEEKKRQFLSYQKIKDPRAYSNDEFKKIENAMDIAKENYMVAKSDFNLSKINLERLLVKSPINGEVLRINIQVGEFANERNDQELIIVGDLSEKYIRVEIDESDASKINKNLNAYGYLRGDYENMIDLEFVRIEPYIKPKTSIAGSKNEKIDTRVVEVIYKIKNDINKEILVGQNIDVFIEI